MLNVAQIICSLDEAKLMRSLGASRRSKRISVSMKRRILNWRLKLPELLSPRLDHCIVDITATDDGRIVLNDGTCFHSPKLARTLRAADRLCCFVATIGSQLEIEVQRCMADNHFADAYILDTLGSMSVEALVDRFHTAGESQFRSRGRGVTLRFSPGYCDWHLTDQISLFSLFKKASPAGVRLTETCLMSPQKSISGVFGILPLDVGQSVANYNPCKACGQPRCRARRA